MEFFRIINQRFKLHAPALESRVKVKISVSGGARQSRTTIAEGFRKRYLHTDDCLFEARLLKTLKISDEAHVKLTSVVGRLMAETGKTKTYSDAIEALLNGCVVLSQGLLENVESFIRENTPLGYGKKEEFIEDAIRFRLTSFNGKPSNASPRKTKQKR